jgi:hypothetical protein
VLQNVSIAIISAGSEREKFRPTEGFLPKERGLRCQVCDKASANTLRSETDTLWGLKNILGLVAVHHPQPLYPQEKEEYFCMNRPVRRYMEKFEASDLSTGTYHARKLPRFRSNKRNFLEYLSAYPEDELERDWMDIILEQDLE